MKQMDCARCGRYFNCRAADIEHCECRQVRLSEEERAYVAAGYNNCLCLDCILELKSELMNSKQPKGA